MTGYNSILESGNTVWTILGNIFRLSLFVAPLHTLKGIVELKHTGPHSAGFYALSFLSCILWVFYGIRYDPNNKDLIIYINVLGTVLYLIYVYIHYLFAPPKQRVRILLWKLAVTVVLIVILLSAIYIVPQSQQKTVVSWVCGVVTVLTYAAPLSVAKQVIETENVTSLPFYISFLTLINSAIWLLYSVSHKDARASLVPNAIGTVFGVAQMLMHALYPDKGPGDPHRNEPEARMVHMGP